MRFVIVVLLAALCSAAPAQAQTAAIFSKVFGRAAKAAAPKSPSAGKALKNTTPIVQTPNKPTGAKQPLKQTTATPSTSHETKTGREAVVEKGADIAVDIAKNKLEEREEDRNGRKPKARKAASSGCAIGLHPHFVDGVVKCTSDP